MANQIDRLKSQLLTSGLSQKDQVLFQIINTLIDAISGTIASTSAFTASGGSGGASNSGSYVTTELEQLSLPNSRQIRHGSGVTMMDNGIQLLIGAAPIPGFDYHEESEAYIPLPGPQGPQGIAGPAGNGGGVSMPLPIDSEFIIPDIGLPFGNISNPLAGQWINVPFNASDFTADGSMTWTVDSGDVKTFQYMITDKAMFVNLVIDNTSIGGTLSNVLFIKIPGGYKARKAAYNTCQIIEVSTGIVGLIRVIGAGSTLIQLLKLSSANYISTVGQSYFRGALFFEVE